MQDDQKRQVNLTVKGCNCASVSLIFPNLGHLESYIPINSMCLEFLVENLRHFISHKGHCVATAHNKWLKKALVMYNNFESCLPSVYKFGMI